MSAGHILQAFRFDGLGGAEKWGSDTRVAEDIQDGKLQA